MHGAVKLESKKGKEKNGHEDDLLPVGKMDLARHTGTRTNEKLGKQKDTPQGK